MFRSIILYSTAVGLIACNSMTDRFQIADQYVPRANVQADLNTTVPIHYKIIRKNISRDGHATIYIEGDGFAYITKSRPSSNPTPKTPVGLMLAAEDRTSQAVYYIARPCQYIKGDQFKQKCETKYWTTHRYAPEIIQSFNQALDKIKSENQIAGFNLVGFSGGANIAGLLAATRDDVHSIRSVAGNVDNDFFTQFHQVSPMPYSLNMANYANKLADLPQVHFVSNHDKFVPLDISQSYLKKLPHQNCTQIIQVGKTTHLDGWQDKWNTLIQNTPLCEN